MNLNPRLFRLFHKMPTLFWFRRKMFSLSALTESHWSLVYLFCSADVLSLSIASYSLVKISKVSKLRKQKIFQFTKNVQIHRKNSWIWCVRSIDPVGFNHHFPEFSTNSGNPGISKWILHMSYFVRLTFDADLGSKSISVRKNIITGWKHLCALISFVLEKLSISPQNWPIMLYFIVKDSSSNIHVHHYFLLDN